MKKERDYICEDCKKEWTSIYKEHDKTCSYCLSPNIKNTK